MAEFYKQKQGMQQLDVHGIRVIQYVRDIAYII